MDLFEQEKFIGAVPLAARMAPKSLDDFIGQEHILGKGKLLRKLIETDKIASVVFYGPPGCGKSALAKIIASSSCSHFEEANAVAAGVEELRKIISAAFHRKKKTLLLVDEIHHFNKSQQDCLLPHVEKGILTLIGITTQNPFFYINPALLSRSLVFEFKKLGNAELKRIIEITASKLDIRIQEQAVEHLVKYSEGDARRLLNCMEIGVAVSEKDSSGKAFLTLATVSEATQKKPILYDKKGDGHYDTISAFIKSMRAGNTSGAVYWLSKMLAAGEDPRFLARRMIIFASEDVGNADTQALVLAVSTLRAVEFVGMPEAGISLAQLAVYLSKAPKSREAYDILEKETEKINKESVREVPEDLKNR
ncbi:MAG: Replication-associated recombination protein A [Elusimicrobia bacterium ADurb.Bin231]|nr:MAG: Replication-associated recombination protein A [Elusimicrobia bacterium ADurb.Bin231]